MREPEWLGWARRLQAIAQTGLAYAQDPFDRERYEAIRGLSVEILERHTGLERSRLEHLFAGESGYQTPKLDVRVVVVRDGEVLLVRQRDDGAWALPGGWVDVDTSVGEAAVKEAREEAGLDVKPQKLIALLDRRYQSLAASPYAIISAFVGCSTEGDGVFRENHETSGAAFFPIDDLPALSPQRTSADQVLMCHRSMSEGWPRTVFD